MTIEKMKIEEIQTYASADSPPTEPFEGLVEIYYQLKGYISSSNKWFWVKTKGKKQRGYQDIDVLAINDAETIIVSVTINLDDKINFSQGKINEDKLKKLCDYFKKVERYLKEVDEYVWLCKDRKVKRVVAYAYGGYKDEEKMKHLEDELKKKEIVLLTSNEIISYVTDRIREDKKKGLKTNNVLVKMIQLQSKKL